MPTIKKQRIAELEKKLAAASSPTPKVDKLYSMKAKETRQRARDPKQRKPKKHRRRGRNATEEKVERAERTENVFPEGNQLPLFQVFEVEDHIR